MKDHKVKNKLDRRLMAAPKGNDYATKRKENPTHTKEEIDKLVKDLLKWADEDDGLFLISFSYEKYGKSESWLRSLGNYHPEVKEALEMAKALIAGKIMRHSWKGDRNANFGEKILPLFSEEYRELIKWKAQLQNLGLNDPKNLSALQEYLDKIKENK